MRKGKVIEQKQLKQINLTEGLMSRIFSLMFKPMMDRGLKKLIKSLYDDPEIQTALADYHAAGKRAKDAFKGYCKDHPDSTLCNKKSAVYRRYMK